MAFTTGDKIREMRIENKTDDSISNEYKRCIDQRDKYKSIYKNSKEQYKNSKEQLELAEERFNSIPLSNISSLLKARKKLKLAKKDFKLKKSKYESDKRNYKLKLRELRDLRKEIRNQYKSNKDYKKFFDRVKRAQNLGINIPKYIMDEYHNQQNVYAQQFYSIDKSGARTFITKPNNDCSKDLQSMINEKIRKDTTDKLNKMKDKLLKKDHSKDKDDR